MSTVVIAPHPVLRQTAKDIQKLDKKVLSIIGDMEKTLLAAKKPVGVGLAAPQVGLPLRIFLARPDIEQPPLIFINPEILEYSQRLQTPNSKKGVYEGCLSIPHHYSPLSRSMSVTVKFQTPVKNSTTNNYELVTKTESFSGFSAHVIQHEMDHLNGILFIDRVLEQNTKLYHVLKDTWEEVNL